jgi:hypothetical protein
MTREEVKKQLLNEIDKSAKKHGGLDEIFCRAPQVGKSSWTWREYREAVEQDKPMENSNDNPIDVYIRYLEYVKKSNHNKLI